MSVDFPPPALPFAAALYEFCMRMAYGHPQTRQTMPVERCARYALVCFIVVAGIEIIVWVMM